MIKITKQIMFLLIFDESSIFAVYGFDFVFGYDFFISP